MLITDMDVLREAVNPWTVFNFRVKRGWKLVVIAALFTGLLAATVALLVLGPQRSGLSWATRELLAGLISALGVLWGLYCGWVLFKFSASRNDRVVMSLRRWVSATIEPLEDQIRALTPEQLRAKTDEFRKRLAEGETLDSIRPEAYACVREVSRRARDHRQFQCQLIGGKVIEDSNVAEMRTGEGKTIVCYMANYMKILQGLTVHMVTVNDYLVRRDAEFCRPIFEMLGVTVGFISNEMGTYGTDAEERRQAYECDITYGTNSEFGFDYLRDNMKHAVRDQVQGKLGFVVVDEVDSILIDEARTPLIISGPANDNIGNYRVADNIARLLSRKQVQANRDMAGRIDDLEKNPPPELKGEAKFSAGLKKFRKDPFWLSSDEAEAIGHMQYFVVELDRKSAHMTEHGAKLAQSELGIGTFYDSKNMNWPHFIDNGLRAHQCYVKDKEYVIQDGQVIIVDEFTGRLMHGRQWSDGLHQAIEAREGVQIKQESQTLATITLQNFFKLYKQLAGMTGTAMTEADEFMKIYKIEVIAIPTNVAVRRLDSNDKIYKTVENKYDAIVEEIHSYCQNGYPADPWSLFDMLKDARRTLRETIKYSRADSTAERGKLEIVKAALDAFNDGKGEEKALEDGYRKLMDDKFGGRPILVGTTSVENSEVLSKMLTRSYGIEHEVLNAKNHAREAEIVAKAGRQHEVARGKKKHMVGNVTIATNMAGRGTDIVLGPGVADIGGLHVIGTERHESRRIDNQLRGRCGRQGDLGSSRFFLSLNDDLLKLFMGEWAMKMLNMLGFEEGMAIEDKRLSKGIARAQKRVEERNFGIRKSLLEYDEVMDHQRKTFYQMRQRVVESRKISELIWEMIDETVDDAIERYYDPSYPAICAAEWVAQHLDTALPAEKLDTSDLDGLMDRVRELAGDEARSNIGRTVGEYVDPDSDPSEWDVRGLSSWISRWGLNLTHNQLRKSDPKDLQEQIIEAALAKIESEDLTPLEQYVDAAFPKRRLIQWAYDKFDVQIPLDDVIDAQREDAARILLDKMQAAYRTREIEYPPHFAVGVALQTAGANRNQVCTLIAQWASIKYGRKWEFEHFLPKDPPQIYEELRGLQEDFLTNGKLELQIDEAIQTCANNGILAWARERFGPLVEKRGLSEGPNLRQELIGCGRELLCRELRQLERYILLQIYDSVWKDHMYAMDLLRSGIGLRGYAERDPKIEYKREGTTLFTEMLSNVRERVTDLVFRAQIAGGAEAGPSGGAPASMTTSHADATNVGFSSAAADHDAAMAKQGEGGKPDPIRRTMPRVGRNQPCPCGSGKKYKQCHGKQSGPPTA